MRASPHMFTPDSEWNWWLDLQSVTKQRSHINISKQTIVCCLQVKIKLMARESHITTRAKRGHLGYRASPVLRCISKFLFNSLAPREVKVILQVCFFHSFYELISLVLAMKFDLGECHRIPLMISPFLFRKWFGAVSQQAINSQCWTRSMSPYFVIETQWIN